MTWRIFVMSISPKSVPAWSNTGRKLVWLLLMTLMSFPKGKSGSSDSNCRSIMLSKLIRVRMALSVWWVMSLPALASRMP